MIFNCGGGSVDGSGGGDKHFVYIKDSASDTWDIVHNLGKYPSISVMDEFGNEVEGEYSHISVNEVQLKFSAAFSGIAFLN